MTKAEQVNDDKFGWQPDEIEIGEPLFGGNVEEMIDRFSKPQKPGKEDESDE